MDISEYFCCDNSGTLFHVNSNLIYNITTLITLYSGTVLTNDYTLPIIVISKVLMANDTNFHAKLYPYYFTMLTTNY